jgi:hypothetical protein
MKYLKSFNTQSDYTNFKSDDSNWIVPSVYLIIEDKTVIFNSNRAILGKVKLGYAVLS